MSQCSIPIYVSLNAKRNELVGITRTGMMSFMHVNLALQYDEDNPEYGNEELISFLSQILGIGNEQVSILKGTDSGIKVIGIEGLDAEQVMAKSKPHMKA